MFAAVPISAGQVSPRSLHGDREWSGDFARQPIVGRPKSDLAKSLHSQRSAGSVDRFAMRCCMNGIDDDRWRLNVACNQNIMMASVCVCPITI